MLRSLLSKRSAMALPAALALSSCADPEASLAEYVGRIPVRDAFIEVDAALDADAVVSDDLEIEGLYLFGLSTFLRPEFPILFGATVTYAPTDPPTADEIGKLTLVLQPLYCKNEGGATPNCTRENVGGPLEAFTFPVNDKGKFTADLGNVTVVGDSNPVSGRAIVATLMLKGSMNRLELCGGIEGHVSDPIDADLLTSENRFGTVYLGAIGDTVDYKTGEVRYDCAPAAMDGAGGAGGGGG